MADIRRWHFPGLAEQYEITALSWPTDPTSDDHQTVRAGKMVESTVRNNND